MNSTQPLPFVRALDVTPRETPSVYPEQFWSRVSGRIKRQLGNVFGLSNFGVNLTSLAPGAESALRHAHTLQDEFVYILSGSPTLITDEGEFILSPGDCAGFRAGTKNAHHLVNRSDHEVVFLEVGDRTGGDSATYPDDDLLMHIEGGTLRFTRKNGKDP